MLISLQTIYAEYCDIDIHIYISAPYTPPTGGGGGGSYYVPPPINLTNVTILANWTQLPKDINITTKGGEYFLETITLLNPTNRTLNLSVYISSDGITDAANWAHQLDDDMRYVNQSIILAPGLPSNPGRAYFNVEIHVPKNVPQYVYRFWIMTKSNESSEMKKTLVTIDTRGYDKFIHEANAFLSTTFYLVKPVFGIEKITVLDVLLIIFIIVAAIAGYYTLRKLYKKKTKPAKENLPEPQTA